MTTWWQFAFFLFWGFSGFINGWVWRGDMEAIKRDKEEDQRHRELMRNLNR
jgi:hypothetical protein